MIPRRYAVRAPAPLPRPTLAMPRAPREPHDLPHHHEVGGEPQAVDDIELVLQAPEGGGSAPAVAADHALVTEGPEMRGSRSVFGGRGGIGEDPPLALGNVGAALGHGQGVGEGTPVVPEERDHGRRSLEVGLAAGEIAFTQPRHQGVSRG